MWPNHINQKCLVRIFIFSDFYRIEQFFFFSPFLLFAFSFFSLPSREKEENFLATTTMNRTVLLLVFLGVWCYTVTAGSGDPIYVSADAAGNDQQDGTQAHPYGTFSQALSSSKLKNGVQILAYPGTYSGEENYDLEVPATMSLSFVVQGEGAVVIDFKESTSGFLNVSQSAGLPFAVEGYSFKNQAKESRTPILNFIGTEETLVSGCSFKSVGYALNMDGVTEAKVTSCDFEHANNIAKVFGSAISFFSTIGTVEDSNFTHCQGKRGGAIYVDETPGGSLEFDNLYLHDNVATESGGAIYVKIGNLSIANSEITNNNATIGSGGGVYAGSPIAIYNTHIEKNNAHLVGGGVVLATGFSDSPNLRSDSIFDQVKFAMNNAPTGAGMHLSSYNPVFITNSIFDRNHAGIIEDDPEDGCGAGLFIDQDSDSITIDNTVFSGNSAESRGGAVYINGPSGSALFQMRSGSVVEGNTAYSSGGGVELEATILFASFVDTTFQDNVVENGPGGALMLHASAEVFSCDFSGNMALNGGALEIDHAGFVALVDSDLTENVANFSGGALRVGLNTGMLIKGAKFIANEATDGGGAFVSPNLPMDIATTEFKNNIAQTGGGLYLSGTAQDYVSGLNLLKIRDSAFIDPLNRAVYSNDGEIVFMDTCQIQGLEAFDDSSISICGCANEFTSISALYIEIDNGSFLADNKIVVDGAFNWVGGRMYGVNSTLCLSGLKTGFGPATHYTLDAPVDIELLGKSTVGATNAEEPLKSKEIRWTVSKSWTHNAPDLYTLDQDIIVNEGAYLSMDKSTKIRVGTLDNMGTLDMQKSAVIDGTVKQRGTLELRYTSVPDDKSAAQIKNADNAGKIIINAPSPTPLKKGESFPALKWTTHKGYFKDFVFKGEYEKGARPALDYASLELKVVMEGGGNSNGGLIAVIVVSSLIVVAFVGGCFLSYRLKMRGGDEEVWEDPVGGDEGERESEKILGSSGGLVEAREEQSLIGNNDL